MKKLFSKIILLIGIGTVVSCEKVIEIPLNEADQQIVVEAVGRNYENESFVLLSRTGTVYTTNDFEKLSEAIVTVTDKDGNETVFTEDALVPGKYVSSDFTTLPNNSYSLKVVAGENELTSTTTTLSTPVLDSLTYISQVGGFGSAATDTNYLVFYNFKDNGAEENYYRVRVWVNGVIDNNFYIGDDALGNGQAVSAPLFATSIGPKDTVHAELLSMDEETYTYLFTLSSNLTTGPFAATPANPVTNVEGGIGYFGAYMLDSLTIIMP